MARVFAELHTAHGVDLRMGAGVSEIHGDGARVSSVTLSDGDTVPADAVVAEVGVALFPTAWTIGGHRA